MGTIAQDELYRLIDQANRGGERVVVATVAHTRGSTPQRRGAKMLFFQSGETAGTVGGGCVEAEVWAEAREAMRSGEPALHHFSLTADEASEEGMVCGGTMDIFIDVWE
ncbi:MAG: XdhC family protein [Pyrinomonadaceae bacterium]